MNKSILLTDALLRKTLTAVRSLGSHGITAYTAEKVRFTPAAFSKYCNGSLVYPDPFLFPADYGRWLSETIRRLDIGVYIPMDDATLHHAMNNGDELATTSCRVVLPPIDSYRIAGDKYRATKLAADAGVPCPTTILPESEHEVARLAPNLAYPAVIKPRLSSGSRGIRIVFNQHELIEQYRIISTEYSQPMIQQFIPPGERFDVCLLYNSVGELRCTFTQKELRHFPIDMGPSTAQQSVWMPELVEQALAIMAKLPWRGVVELEFMKDPRDGELKFMEINPRFWNSLHLAVQCGVDFPNLLYQVAMKGDVESVNSYQIGNVATNKLPGDLLHFIGSPDRFKMTPPLLGKGNHIQDDIWSWNDPFPSIGFAAACLEHLFHIDAWRMLLKR